MLGTGNKFRLISTKSVFHIAKTGKIHFCRRKYSYFFIAPDCDMKLAPVNKLLDHGRLSVGRHKALGQLEGSLRRLGQAVQVDAFAGAFPGGLDDHRVGELVP